MARSTWKGPFVHPSILKKVDAARASGKNVIIQTYSRASVILPHFMGLTFGVYNGRKFIPVIVTDNMIGHRLGEFAPTRTFVAHTAADKKAEPAKAA
jgi:small subunit ribosomal protein S19